MSPSRLPTGTSDPVSFSCTCAASDTPGGGLVLLFYRYFSANPALSPTHSQLAKNPSPLADFHTSLTQKLQLGGKIRIAKEGFNITVGGASDAIQKYIQALLPHWSLSGLDLDTPEEQRLFFKPTTGGCACVFGGAPASVQVKAEITPMGVTNYLPKNWNEVESLDPEVFHERCWERGGERVLIDVRNHYESRIGYFVDPVSGESAVRPGIRRFSQWPGFAKRLLGNEGEGRGEGGRQIMTYCTGGIRCEKGVRWMQENMEKREGDVVCTLKGGIAAYLMWMDEEIKSGRKRPQESLFKGKNYVFDARGSMGLSEGVEEPVASCHCCGKPEDRLSKCRSRGCHLVLVVCGSCEERGDPRCCSSCRNADTVSGEVEATKKPKAICACEQKREAELWGGGEQIKLSQKGRRKLSKGVSSSPEINIKIKIIG